MPRPVPGNFFTQIWTESDPAVRSRLIGLYACLFAANIAVLGLGLVAPPRQHGLARLGVPRLYVSACAMRSTPTTSPRSTMSTRKLMQQGQRPVGVGLFFSLGHSAVVVLLWRSPWASRRPRSAAFEDFKAVGGIIGTSASALFLFLLALVQHHYPDFGLADVSARSSAASAFVEEDFDILLNNRGFLARLFRPLFRHGDKSWHLFPIGFLFGLGFDTATEVALFGISATQAANGVAFGTLMVFPALFTAGMSLIDTTDGVLMLGAYGWAFMKPIRKLYLQPHHHRRLGHHRGPDRRHRDARVDRRSVQARGAVLGRRSAPSTIISACSATSSSAYSPLSWLALGADLSRRRATTPSRSRRRREAGLAANRSGGVSPPGETRATRSLRKSATPPLTATTH